MPTHRDVPRADEHDQPQTTNPTLDRYLTITAPRRHRRTERNRDTPRVVGALDNEGLDLWEMNDFA